MDNAEKELKRLKDGIEIALNNLQTRYNEVLKKQREVASLIFRNQGLFTSALYQKFIFVATKSYGITLTYPLPFIQDYIIQKIKTFRSFLFLYTIKINGLLTTIYCYRSEKSSYI